MTQPGGIGTKVVWKDPADYAETMLGFRRYFTLENRICPRDLRSGPQPAQALEGLQGQGRPPRPRADGRRCRRVGPLRGGLLDAGGQHAGGGEP